MASFGFSDPATDAYAYSEAVADALGDGAADVYFEALVDELFELHPGIRERFSDAVLADLCEEVARREDPKYAHATVELIGEIASDWSNDA